MHWPFHRTRQAITQLTVAVCLLKKEINIMANTLQEQLQAAEAREVAASDKIIALLDAQALSLADLANQLAAAITANDPAALQAVVDGLNAESDKLDAEAAAHTPPAPPAPPAPRSEDVV